MKYWLCITLQLAQKKNGHGTKQKLMNMWEEMVWKMTHCAQEQAGNSPKEHKSSTL